MTGTQLCFVDACDLGQRNAENVRRHRHAPERVAKLLHDGIAVECTPCITCLRT